MTWKTALHLCRILLVKSKWSIFTMICGKNRYFIALPCSGAALIVQLKTTKYNCIKQNFMEISPLINYLSRMKTHLIFIFPFVFRRNILHLSISQSGTVQLNQNRGNIFVKVVWQLNNSVLHWYVALIYLKKILAFKIKPSGHIKVSNVLDIKVT